MREASPAWPAAAVAWAQGSEAHPLLGFPKAVCQPAVCREGGLGSGVQGPVADVGEGPLSSHSHISARVASFSKSLIHLPCEMSAEETSTELGELKKACPGRHAL